MDPASSEIYKLLVFRSSAPSEMKGQMYAVHHQSLTKMRYADQTECVNGIDV